MLQDRTGRLQTQQQDKMLKISIFVIKFFLFGALFIVSNNDLYLNNPSDFEEFMTTYVHWIDAMYSNLLTATGYVVQLEWMPDTSNLVIPIISLPAT